MFFIGIRRATRDIAQGPVENAEKYDCAIFTEYDNEICKATVLKEVMASGKEVRVVSIRARTNSQYHNLHGPARIELEETPNILRIKSVEYYIDGEKTKGPFKAELIDPALADTYRTVGFTVIGKYILRKTE